MLQNAYSNLFGHYEHEVELATPEREHNRLHKTFHMFLNFCRLAIGLSSISAKDSSIYFIKIVKGRDERAGVFICGERGGIAPPAHRTARSSRVPRSSTSPYIRGKTAKHFRPQALGYGSRTPPSCTRRQFRALLECSFYVRVRSTR